MRMWASAAIVKSGAAITMVTALDVLAALF